ncbi:uncharacterized protein LOC120079448 isoform X3 [Benincasa hispida]|uniref:uncharacterized protein LOC120079448 isoform X3 n=1 Tax=Benincasa hispida TaxID=102211 RepID=UPI001902753E|nr:uncharacterized protein LOC120079448 isoform X3 [Benincasa hispida]
MASSVQSTLPAIRTVTISYSELQDRSVDLSMKIEEGFGPKGLGILSVTDVPGFPSLRQDLLRLSSRFGKLPEDAKKELEDPHNLLKGSFYANPILDTPTTDTSSIQRYPSYCGSNIWPSRELPELELAFKTLGKLILDVGLMLAYHCDQYAAKMMKVHEDEALEKTLLNSRCHKGRLLYYFPAQQSTCSEDSDNLSSWCGWHTDHGSLTGLTCAMFTRDGVEIPCPDNAAGLYIRTRADEIVKVEYRSLSLMVYYGENEIAYQIGETTEILSRGYLCATPHCVRAPKGKEAFNLERSTFALFMQPDWDQKLNFPEEVHIHREIIPTNCALTFGEYSEKLLDKYYHLKS